MATTTTTTFDADGNVLSVEEFDIPDTSTTPNIVDLADRIAAAQDAINFLILAQLGGF